MRAAIVVLRSVEAGRAGAGGSSGGAGAFAGSAADLGRSGTRGGAGAGLAAAGLFGAARRLFGLAHRGRLLRLAHRLRLLGLARRRLLVGFARRRRLDRGRLGRGGLCGRALGNRLFGRGRLGGAGRLALRRRDPGAEQGLAIAVERDPGIADQVARLLAEDLGQALGRVVGREDVALERQSLDDEYHLTGGDVAPGVVQPVGDVLGGVVEMVAVLGDLVRQDAEEIGEGPRREHRDVGRRMDLAGEALDLGAVGGGDGCRLRHLALGQEGAEGVGRQGHVGGGS